MLSEFYWNSTRLKIVTPARARDLVRVWSEHDTVNVTSDLILRAISLHQDHSLPIWDGLIIEAALSAGCDILVTEDMQHGRRFGDLEIRNPFVAPSAHPSRAAYGATRRPKTKGRRIRPAS